MASNTETFPFRIYEPDNLLDEFRKLRVENATVTSRRGYKCSNAFFQYERMRTPTHKHKSCVEYWRMDNKREYIHKYRKKNKYTHDIYRDIQFLFHPPAQFSPMIAKYMYSMYNATAVFDPFAGWGDRCVAAMACGIDYVGADTNDALKKPYLDMVAFYTPASSSNVSMYFCSCIDVDLNAITFDFVCSSPPFFEKDVPVERYKNFDDVSYDDFMRNVLKIIVERCLDKVKYVALFIPRHMNDDLISLLYNVQCDSIDITTSGNKTSKSKSVYVYTSL